MDSPHSTSTPVSSPAPPGVATEALRGAEAKAKSPTSFSGLARRILSRTTDLIVIAFVLMTALWAGGHFRDWWNLDPRTRESPAEQAASVAGDAEAWEQDRKAVTMAFGDAKVAAERYEVAGTRAIATTRLLDECQRLVIESTLPTGPIDSAERGMLDFTRNMKPARASRAQDEAGWRVSLSDGPVILAVGQATADKSNVTAEAKSQSKSAEDPSGFEVARVGGGERVICWGLAFPIGEETWTLYLFRPRGLLHAESRSSERDAVELPTGVRRELSFQFQTGGECLLFRGEVAEGAEWEAAFEERLQAEGWRQVGTWTRDSSASSWQSGRFEKVEQDATRQVLDVSFGPETDREGTRETKGTWRGVLMRNIIRKR